MKNLNPTAWRNSEFSRFLDEQKYNVLEYFKKETSQNNVSIIAFDLKGKVTFINSDAKEIFFNDHEKVVDKPLDEVFKVFRKGKDFRTKSGWRQLIRQGLLISADMERTVETNRNGRTSVWLTGSPLLDRIGNLVGGVFSCKKVRKTGNTGA